MGQSWYDKECRIEGDKFKEYQKHYYETGLDEDRIFMCQQRSVYRSKCRDKKREFCKKEGDRLVELSKKNPKMFWRELKGHKKKGGTTRL